MGKNLFTPLASASLSKAFLWNLYEYNLSIKNSFVITYQSTHYCVNTFGRIFKGFNLWGVPNNDLTPFTSHLILEFLEFLRVPHKNINLKIFILQSMPSN